LFGLTFKAGTADLRDSPALAVAALLRQAGAELSAYDPGLTADLASDVPAVSVAGDPYVAAKGADAIVILTEWPEFRTLDWARLAAIVGTPTLVDTRNLIDPDVAVLAGFDWIGLGRRPVQGP
jgi:UDPglucose 6-dehydrogenase